MITKVVLAKLSPTMEEGTIVKWTKNEGDAVKVGDVLAEIETDKANMEMEALGDGVLRRILVPAGGKAPVGALIGVVAGADEDIARAARGGCELRRRRPRPPQPTTAKPAGPTASLAGPCGTRLRPLRAPEGGRVKASPLARAMAAERQLPLAVDRRHRPRRAHRQARHRRLRLGSPRAAARTDDGPRPGSGRRSRSRP